MARGHQHIEKGIAMPEEEIVMTWAPPTAGVVAVYAQENLPEEEVQVVVKPRIAT
jgi:hypothetical protein